MPISKIDENMERAHLINAYTEQKFWFRTDIVSKSYRECRLSQTDYTLSNDSKKIHDTNDLYEEMYIYEILEGKSDIGFKGIYPLIYDYLRGTYPKDQIEKVNVYLDFFLGRAKGQHETGARYIRKLVEQHPDYKQDSIISQTIAYDIITDVLELNSNEEKRNKYYGLK